MSRSGRLCLSVSAPVNIRAKHEYDIAHQMVHLSAAKQKSIMHKRVKLLLTPMAMMSFVFYDFLRQGEPKNVTFYSGSLTTSWSIRMIIFDPVKKPLVPLLLAHSPLKEKRPLGEGLTTYINQKEKGDARKHCKSAEKNFQTSLLME